MNDAAEMCVIPLTVVCDTYDVIPMYDVSTVIIIIIIIIFKRRTNTCSYLRDERVIYLMGISVYNYYTNISCSERDDYIVAINSCGIVALLSIAR